MTDQELYHKANARLDAIFAGVPADCEGIRLSVRVYFKTAQTAAQYILTGYLYPGADRTWQRSTERDDQLPFTQAQLDAASAGWVAGQPTRRSAMEFLYTFTPDEGQHVFALRSRPVEYTERRHMEKVASEFGFNWS